MINGAGFGETIRGINGDLECRGGQASWVVFLLATVNRAFT